MNNTAIFLLKNRIFRKGAFKKYNILCENDKKSPKEIISLNWNKRVEIVKFAYENIPFYKNFYNSSGFHPSHLQVPADWQKVPILTKDLLRNNTDNIFNRSIKRDRIIKSSTGGTTGEPLVVFHDKNNFLDVNGWRVMKWWGLNLASNIGFVFRQTRLNKLKILLNAIIWFPTKRYFLDASSVTTEEIEPFVGKLNSGNVKILQGYTGALNEIAIYIINNKIEISKNLKAIWCTSSPLTKAIRENLLSAFQCEIYDQYGSGEVYWIATECSRHEGLHIHSDLRHIDVINEKNEILENGNLGNVLVTDLDNFLFPIIKYKNGDLTVIKKNTCSCGLPYPLLEKIYGRISDSIKLPNGGFISGDFFTTIFDDYVEVIKQFQVHQKVDFSIDIKVVLKSSNSDSKLVLSKIEKLLKEKTLNLVQINIIVLPVIDNNKGGKNRFVVCDIK